MVLNASLEACLVRGSVVVDGPRGMGEQRFAVIRDPAGAHMGLIGRRAWPYPSERRGPLTINCG